MACSPRPPVRPGERGAVTWVTVLFLALLAGAAYLLAVYGPLWIVQYEAKQVVRDYGNQAVKNPRDDELLEHMCQKLQALDTVEVPGADGNLERRPAVDVHPQDVTWERDTSEGPPHLHVAFEYRRDLHFPLLDRWKEVNMQVDLTMDLSRADWGPSR